MDEAEEEAEGAGDWEETGFAEDEPLCWEDAWADTEDREADEEALVLSGIVAPMVMNGMQMRHKSKIRQSTAFPFMLISHAFRLQTFLQLA